MTLDTPTRWELDPAVADIDFATDPLEGDRYHRIVADLRSRHRVAPVLVFGQPAWMVIGFEELKDFCRRDADFPGGVSYAVNTEPVVGRTFISMDGGEHDIYRQLAMPAFRSRPTARFVAEGLSPLVHEVVDRFADRGEADLVDAFTGVLPFFSISRKLGLPYGSEEDQRRWARDMLAMGWDPDGARRAAA
jgi:cytochrome P450